jgi:ribonucleoside-diphosphate reductase alpha subunit
MRVKKRDGQLQEVSFDKVIKRLKHLCEMTPILDNIDATEIAQKVCARIYDGVSTGELDELAGEQCTQKSVDHLQYSQLASRIIISNNQKVTSASFSDTIHILFNNKDVHGKAYPLISTPVYDFIMNHKDQINDYIDYTRDYNFDYFGFKTLEKAYLMRIDNVTVERIQHLIMRVSIGIHSDNITDALETYDLISSKCFTHATPTLFHSGTPRPQLLSCFLLGVEDSVEGMYKAISDCAQISKWAGGIGVHIHDIRGENARIRSTNGHSNGIIPMLKVYNEVARHINQSGKRNGSFAIYLEPHHPDILAFLEAKKNHGDENARARDLFYAIWISDLFMKRVKSKQMWSLMCPDKCKGLSDVYGDKYEELYTKYESNPENIVKQLPAQQIWKEILISQMETGTPYLCYKDAANNKTNQKNVGTIKSSNLCTEIIEYSDHKEYACCTLASIALGSFVEPFDISTVNSVKIYSKTDCDLCTYSKNYLDSFHIPYEEINLDDPSKRNSFFAKLNRYTDDDDDLITSFPQIYINNDRIGGFDEMYSHFKPVFNFKKLHHVTKVVTNNLNKIININFYPVKETMISNHRHRPLGIGVQGLADVYAMFKCSFDSAEATMLNKQIFATIYHAACEKSMCLAKDRSGSMTDLKSRLGTINNVPDYYDSNFELPNLKTNSMYHKLQPTKEELNRDTHLGAYSTFIGSPIHEGKFQFNLWNINPIDKVSGIDFNWEELRGSIKEYGVRNSLLLAPMPTASTSQILGFNECIEPFTSNIYSRGTLAGQFLVINKYLQDDLIRLKLWDSKLKDLIILNNGSISTINNIPILLKKIYKTAWDLSMKSLIDQAADRGAYVCQSQSLNLWIQNPDISKLSSMHFYSWSRGLKTGIYYLRRRAVSKAQTFSIEVQSEPDCLMCSS